VYRAGAAVSPEDFDDLRRDRKTIEGDIEYRPFEGNPDVWVFEGVEVSNNLGHTVFLNGAYDRRTGHIKFNFVLRNKGKQAGGPICRLEIKGKDHPPAGRTHKHHVCTNHCVRRHLPHAIPRPELEDCDLRTAWDTLCRQANIDHTGKFSPPPERGK
jgi:hypothetical protein